MGTREGIKWISIWFSPFLSNILLKLHFYFDLHLQLPTLIYLHRGCLSRFQSHQNQLLMGGLGGNRLNWTNFDTPSFLAILRDPAGDPQSSWSSGWRRAGTKQHRLFTNTSWSAGTSKGLGLEVACYRALPVFVFSKRCNESFPPNA